MQSLKKFLAKYIIKLQQGNLIMTIKQLRESTTLSQQKFADKFNIPVANI